MSYTDYEMNRRPALLLISVFDLKIIIKIKLSHFRYNASEKYYNPNSCGFHHKSEQRESKIENKKMSKFVKFIVSKLVVNSKNYRNGNLSSVCTCLCWTIL